MLAFLAAARQALSLAGPAGRTVVIGNQVRGGRGTRRLAFRR